MAHILVIEDSADQARLISALLESGGHTVSVVTDGRLALAAIAEQSPDLVATDLMMRGVTGLEIVEEVTRNHPLVPVILMTAYGSGEIGLRALQRGAASYVPKSRVQEDLLPTIESTLASSRSRLDRERLLSHLVSSRSRFDLENDPGLVVPLVRYVQERLEVILPPGDDNLSMQVGIAIHEAVLNAMYHGNLEVGSDLRETDPDAYRRQLEERRRDPTYGSRRVSVEIDIDAGRLTVIVRDEGRGFDPTEVPDPTDVARLERVSGRGLYLIHAFMDEVRHNAQGNEITMRKDLPARDDSSTETP